METTLTTAAGPDLARAVAEAGRNPEWLREWREQAWEHYVSEDLPDRVEHLWRYTDPTKFLSDKTEAVIPGEREPIHPSRALGLDAGELSGYLLHRDGGLVDAALDDTVRDAGVILTDLQTAAREHPEIVREYLGKAVPFDHSKFAGLNAALFSGGSFLYVPEDLVVELPLHVRYLGGRDLSAQFPRILLVVEQGAEVTLIDEYAADPEAVHDGSAPRVLAHSVVEGHVGRNARLDYIHVQLWGERTRSHLTQRHMVAADGTASSVIVSLGGYYNKADIGTVLTGGNAMSEMIGVCFGDRHQHFDHHTEHVHRHGYSYSDMDIKVVLEDHARSAYTGLIRIDLDAPQSEAYQENRNLLLDETSSADSIPELEILNDEVRCTHGATVGPIDEEQVFYLMTRGLTEHQAERAIVEGFFEPAVTRINHEGLRERVWGYISDKLESR